MASAVTPPRQLEPSWFVLDALLRGDFLLTNLQRCPRQVEPSWFVLNARGGYLLLLNCDEGSDGSGGYDGWLALLNPLAQPRERFFHVDDIRIFDDDDPNPNNVRRILRAGVILDVEKPETFGIFCLATQGAFRLRAAVFSSAGADGMEGGWNLSQWLEVPPHPDPVDPEIHGRRWQSNWLESSMRVGNVIYWPYRNRQHVVALDPTHPVAPRLFLEGIAFPDGMDPGYFGRYIIGETHGGTLSIAYTNGMTIVHMVRLQDGNPAGTWATVSHFDLAADILAMLEQFPDGGLEIAAIRGSVVYYTTSQMYHPSQPLLGRIPVLGNRGIGLVVCKGV